MIPVINSVKLTPLILKKGDFGLTVEVDASDDVSVTQVGANLIDTKNNPVFESDTVLSLSSGDVTRGTYKEIISIPPEIKDGVYVVAVYATDDDSDKDKRETYATNAENKVTLERETSDNTGGGSTGGGSTGGGSTGGGSTGGGSTGGDDDSECCCKVAINISGGPVNIYVCDSQKKI